MKKFVWSNLILAAAIICLPGCGKKSETASSEKTAANYPLPDPPLVDTNCAPGKPGGRFVVAAAWSPKTFNPVTANEMSSEDIIRLLFASLVGYDPISQQIQPGLADWWTNSPDGKTWTFKLRKNLRWSDGAPLTADDVVFTWNDVIYNPKINNVTRDAFIIHGKKFVVTKVNDLTVQVVTPEVYAPFLEFFGGTPIIPKHILAKYVNDGTFSSAYGVNWKPQDIVCSGPFQIKEYKPAQYTLLERNPYFCEVDTKGQRLPYFDNVIYTVVPDENAINLRFLSGGCDADDFIHPDAYDQFKTAEADGHFKLVEPGIGLETTFFFFNENTNVNPQTGKPYVDPVKLKWFRNTKFRQACSYAINREAIAKSVFADRAIPNYGFVTPGNKKWYDPNIKKYPYNPAKALELLKEIGIDHRNADGILEDAGGHPIEFVLNTDTDKQTRIKAAVMIQSDLDKLGFKVIFQPIEFNTLINKLDVTYNYDCALLGLGGAGTDPGSNMNVLKSTGFTHMWFPGQKQPSTPWEARIDTLMDAQMQTLDFAQRKKDFNEVQEIMAEEQPLIFTVTPFYYAAIRSDIGNVRPTPLDYHRVTWNAEELYFKN
jgi:peptide/nickel transport system substrate-binding protein